MRRRSSVLLVAALALSAATLGCSDDDSGGDDETTDDADTASSTTSSTTSVDDQDDKDDKDDQDGTSFTWVTTMEIDGSGYVLTVDGGITDDHATYRMQVEPTGNEPNLQATTAGASVNGLTERGAPLEDIDVDGATEVLVAGTDRWYRSPWLRSEAAPAMDGAEWVHVTGEAMFVADISRHVLRERYDEALRMLLAMLAAGDGIQAPRAAASASTGDVDLDDLLSPWIGLVGPDAPDGAPAVFSGDQREGTASWDQTIIGGRLAGEVTWAPAASTPPDPPDPSTVIELDRLADQFAQAG